MDEKWARADVGKLVRRLLQQSPIRDDGFLGWGDNSVQKENGEDLKSLLTGRMDRKEDLAMHSMQGKGIKVILGFLAWASKEKGTTY